MGVKYFEEQISWHQTVRRQEVNKARTSSRVLPAVSLAVCSSAREITGAVRNGF